MPVDYFVCILPLMIIAAAIAGLMPSAIGRLGGGSQAGYSHSSFSSTSYPAGSTGALLRPEIEKRSTSLVTTTGLASVTIGRTCRLAISGGSKRRTRGTHMRCTMWATSQCTERASTFREIWWRRAAGLKPPRPPVIWTRTKRWECWQSRRPKDNSAAGGPDAFESGSRSDQRLATGGENERQTVDR